MKIAAEPMQALASSLNPSSRSKGTTEEAEASTFSFKIPKWDPVASRKTAAKAKLDMLKRQLEGMLKFAGVGKSNVAAAARLAKQVAAAVAEYAGISGASAVQPPTITGSSTTPEASASSADTAGAGQVAEQALQKVAEAEEKKNDGTQTVQQSKSHMSQEDRDFLEDAKKVMQKVKMLLALEIQKSKRESKTDKALYKDAIKAMDNTLKQATAALEQAAKSANAPMVYTANGNTTAIQVSMPQISVQA
jgi:hypothetical protein